MDIFERITNLEREEGLFDEEVTKRMVSLLADAVRKLAGWVKCPECLKWHKPENGLTLEKCGCGYNFRSQKMEEKVKFSGHTSTK